MPDGWVDGWLMAAAVGIQLFRLSSHHLFFLSPCLIVSSNTTMLVDLLPFVPERTEKYNAP
jgi:hypothetical protein